MRLASPEFSRTSSDRDLSTRLVGVERSSEAYSVRLLGRTRLQYRDELSKLDIFAEPMSQPSSEVTVDISSIPDRPGRSREEVADRLQRAFAFAGWALVLSGFEDLEADA